MESDSRVAAFLYRALLYQNYGFQCYKAMVKTDEVNYLTLRDNGQLSFLPKGKTHTLTDDGRWARDGRQNGAPSRIIRKVLTPNALKLFKDAEFEAFCNSYKCACEREQKSFIIRPNADIPDVYCMTREQGGGSLNDSCMNGDEDYLSIYAYCPKVRILTLIDSNGSLSGRALLWDVGDGDTFMDRIYVVQDHYYELFLDYAKDNNFIRKVEYKNYRDKQVMFRNGEQFSRTFKIVTGTEFDYYPYIDTFTYGGDGFLSNSSNGCMYEYNQTGGGREGGTRMVFCAYDEVDIDEDDATYIERGTYRGQYIHTDHTVYCETDGYYYYNECDTLCEINGNYYRKDDDDIVEVDGELYHVNSDDIAYSDFYGEYVLVDDCVYSEHHECHIKSDEAYEVAGEYFHESVVNKVA